MKEFLSLFMADHALITKNILMLGQKYKGTITLNEAKELPYWEYEQMITIANDQAKEEKEQREREEKNSKSNTSVNPSSYLNKMSGIANKFK